MVWTQHPALPSIKVDLGTGGDAMRTKRLSQASQVAIIALMKIRKMFLHPNLSKIPNRKKTMEYLLRRLIRQPDLRTKFHFRCKSSRTVQPIWPCTPTRLITI